MGAQIGHDRPGVVLPVRGRNQQRIGLHVLEHDRGDGEQVRRVGIGGTLAALFGPDTESERCGVGQAAPESREHGLGHTGQQGTNARR